MEIDLDLIRSKNQIEYGTGNTHLDLLRSIYPERTHFIFELIQNASDAAATEVDFRLSADALHFTHNGRPFDARDVEAICRIAEGTKKDDVSKVGKFGIGFKAVYNYTTRPEVYSSGFSFCIQDYVRPYALPPREVEEGKTLFIFPFNRSEFPAERAVSEIVQAFAVLDRRNLIFLNSIRSINWRAPNGRSGELRKSVLETAAHHQLVSLSTAGRIAEQWYVFSKKIDDDDQRPSAPLVQLAFLQEMSNIGKPCVQPLEQSYLHVCFSTHKKVPIGYLINGPFFTTPARDNLDNNNNERNQQIINASTDLLRLALLQFKADNLITGKALQTLAIAPKQFPRGDLFRSLFDNTRQCLLNEEILPTLSGTHAPARLVLIPGSTEIRNLFGREEIAALLRIGFGADWLEPSIADKAELSEYLESELGIKKITIDNVINVLDERYLAKQSDEWMVRFYSFCQKQKPEIIRKLRTMPIVRLEDGTHVSAVMETGKLNAYFPMKGVTGLPFVKANLIKNTEAKAFLQQLGLTEPDDLHDTLNTLIPQLQDNGEQLLDDETYARAVRQIMFAFKQADRHQTTLLESRLRTLPFLRGRHGALRSEKLLRANEVYSPTDRLVNYFQAVENVWFPDLPPEAQDLIPFLKPLGLLEYPAFVRTAKHSLTEQELKAIEPDDRLRGRPTDYELKGLEEFVQRMSVGLPEQRLNHARVLWKLLSDIVEAQDPPFAEVPREFRSRTTTDKAKPKWLRLLQSFAWLPGHTPNSFVFTAELSLNELPPEFVRNKKLATLLEMKDVVLGLLAQQSGISADILEFVRLNPERISELMSRANFGGGGVELPQAVAPAEKPKSAPVKSKPVKPPAGSFLRAVSPRGTTKRDSDTHAFLLEQYGGKCQICSAPGFTTSRGDVFFEAIFIVSTKKGANADFAGNVISVCALCCAKLLNGKTGIPDNVLGILRTLDAENTDEFSLPIKMCDERCQIVFSAEHKKQVKSFIESERWRDS